MTNKERALIDCGDFNKIWNTTWGYSSYKNLKINNEEQQSREKYALLCASGDFHQFIANCLTPTTPPDVIYSYISPTSVEETPLYPKDGWDEPEWGFPKGRREYKETDYNCALREFHEETGIPLELLHQINNVSPVEENFMGSNFKSYKHRYYVMFMNYEDTLLETNFQKTEVSCVSWKTVEECIQSIRPYNIEKKTLIYGIDEMLNTYVIL
jgi:ADP-ribose pyrophosphatase YjhB (NUDIX family)